MKTLLYMGITPNGLIAKADGSSEFTSEEDLKGFFDNSKSVGNVVMGKNTYLEASKQGYFPFPEALNIVVSHEKIENKWGDNVLFTDKTPKEILLLLQNKGFQRTFLIGGGQLNSSFMQDGLIDEIYLDVEPLIFGQGIKVFSEANFEYELELIETKKLNKDTVQLHYKVIK